MFNTVFCFVSFWRSVHLLMKSTNPAVLTNLCSPCIHVVKGILQDH